MTKHRLRLVEIADRKHPLVDEEFEGSDLAAEQRLNAIWNDSIAAVQGERYRATARRIGERGAWMTIGW